NQMERALRERENRFRRLADYAPMMIWMTGTDKLCKWVNKPWLKFTGRSIDQELGNGWTEGLHPQDRDRCVEIFVRAFESRRPFTVECRFRRHDNQWRWIHDTGVPLYQENGTFDGYIGSCIDITAMKQTEQELERHRKDLRTMASELM